jgi:hypothetical protein
LVVKHWVFSARHILFRQPDPRPLCCGWNWLLDIVNLSTVVALPCPATSGIVTKATRRRLLHWLTFGLQVGNDFLVADQLTFQSMDAVL